MGENTSEVKMVPIDHNFPEAGMHYVTIDGELYLKASDLQVRMKQTTIELNQCAKASFKAESSQASYDKGLANGAERQSNSLDFIVRVIGYLRE